MAGSELIMILAVAVIGYYLYSTGKLDELIGSVSGQQQQQGDVTQENVGGSGENIQEEEQSTEIENGEAKVSGKNAGAIVNGKCVGDPAQCAKAQELLDDIRNR